MELRHLRYFLAVAEEKHFGRAAEALHMAQPPLSSQIKQLETELGTPLFERTTRRVELTEAGELFVARARQLLIDLDAAAFDVGEIGRGAAGVVRVGFSGTATYQLMPEIVRLAKTELPNVRLQISGEMLTPQMESALLENRLDVAVLRPPVRSDELDYESLEQTPLAVALPTSHPLATAAPNHQAIAVSELTGIDLVSYPRASSVASATWELCRRAGFRPRIVQEATETSTLVALVGAGLGAAFIPRSAALPLTASVTVRPLAEDITIGLGAAWRTNASTAITTPTPLQTSFIRLAHQATANLRENR